jgi:hypothetical protein
MLNYQRVHHNLKEKISKGKPAVQCSLDLGEVEPLLLKDISLSSAALRETWLSSIYRYTGYVWMDGIPDTVLLDYITK